MLLRNKPQDKQYTKYWKVLVLIIVIQHSLSVS